jgi:protein-L-isoaspartate(D-aspartate) O-methyltransferase
LNDFSCREVFGSYHLYCCITGLLYYRIVLLTLPMRPTEDTYKHKGLREKLAGIIRSKGITSEPVLKAIETVPRHLFMDSAFDQVAYEDRAFPIGEEQTISQPYTVAYQTQLLNIKPYDRVLEIGTGSAYQAAVLAEMKAQVFTIERQKKLYENNRLLPVLKKYPMIKLFYGDGYLGLPTYAPFDKILITAAAPVVPPKLLQQLKPGGCMVIPLGEGEVQCMQRITRNDDDTFYTESFASFSFVPMLEGKRG